MFFIIVMVIFWVIELTGAATLLYFRKEPCIAVRDLSMNISCSILLLCMYSLIASVFEPYFAGEEWLSRCPLLYWTFVFATPATSLVFFLFFFFSFLYFFFFFLLPHSKSFLLLLLLCSLFSLY